MHIIYNVIMCVTYTLGIGRRDIQIFHATAHVDRTIIILYITSQNLYLKKLHNYDRYIDAFF